MAPLPARYIPHAVLGALSAFAVAIWLLVAYSIPLPDGEDDYNSPGFIVRHAWVKFGLVITDPLRANLTAEQEDAKLRRFFELNSLIRERERLASDPTAADATSAAAADEARAMRDERGDIENAVEEILAGRLTEMARDAGLTFRFGGELVWPPVNFEFEDPPAVLVTSPRDEIRKASESLLRGDLPIERVQRIEAEAERDGETSALVVNVAGIAMYPAIIPHSDDYRFVLHDIAHEWMHHYLFFSPLGRRYFSSGELTTLNETVANMVGRELGDAMLARYPLDEPPVNVVTPKLAAPAPQLDFTAEMRGLRREVEVLLNDGLLDEAERLMEEKRLFLAENGYYIRRLNQAYFAFHGSYADSAGSIDPIGPKLERLRDGSTSLEEFVETARELTSEAELDAVLAR